MDTAQIGMEQEYGHEYCVSLKAAIKLYYKTQNLYTELDILQIFQEIWLILSGAEFSPSGLMLVL